MHAFTKKSTKSKQQNLTKLYRTENLSVTGSSWVQYAELKEYLSNIYWQIRDADLPLLQEIRQTWQPDTKDQRWLQFAVEVIARADANADERLALEQFFVQSNDWALQDWIIATLYRYALLPHAQPILENLLAIGYPQGLKSVDATAWQEIQKVLVLLNATLQSLDFVNCYDTLAENQYAYDIGLVDKPLIISPSQFNLVGATQIAQQWQQENTIYQINYFYDNVGKLSRPNPLYHQYVQRTGGTFPILSTWVLRLSGENHQAFSDTFFLKVAQTFDNSKDEHWWNFLTQYVNAHFNANYVAQARGLMQHNSYRMD